MTMTEFLKQRPWLWIVVVLVLFVAVDALLLYVAQSSHGPDVMEEPAPASPAAPAAPARR